MDLDRQAGPEKAHGAAPTTSVSGCRAADPFSEADLQKLNETELAALAKNEIAVHTLDALTQGKDRAPRTELVRGVVQLNGAGLAGAIAILSVQDVSPGWVGISGVVFYLGLLLGLCSLCAEIAPAVFAQVTVGGTKRLQARMMEVMAKRDASPNDVGLTADQRAMTRAFRRQTLAIQVFLILFNWRLVIAISGAMAFLVGGLVLLTAALCGAGV